MDIKGISVNSIVEHIPATTYRVGGSVTQRKIFVHHENRTCWYTLLDAHSATTLRFRPFLAFRRARTLHENAQASRDYQLVENGIQKTCMYPVIGNCSCS